MTDHINEIDKIIQKAALDGVLTKGAVTQFNELIHERDALAKTVDEQKIALEKEIAGTKELLAKLSTYSDMEQQLITREASVEEEELTHRDRRIQLECAELRVKDHKEMVSLVFRNTVLKKQVVTPGSATIDQYGTRNSEFPDTTPVEEEET